MPDEGVNIVRHTVSTIKNVCYFAFERGERTFCFPPHIGHLNERIGPVFPQRAAESSSLTSDGRLSNIASKTWAGPVG